MAIDNPMINDTNHPIPQPGEPKALTGTILVRATVAKVIHLSTAHNVIERDAVKAWAHAETIKQLDEWNVLDSTVEDVELDERAGDDDQDEV